MHNLRAKVVSVLDIMNREFFGGELPQPTVVVRTNNKFVVRYLPDSFQMVLGSLFSKVSLREIYDSLLHECCHLYNGINHVTDHSRKSQYHNRAFADTALGVGLNVAKTEQGWLATSSETGELAPADRWSHRENVYQRLFQEYSDLQSVIIERKQKTFQYKYQCSCKPPHNSIRSGRTPNSASPLRVRCEICNELFVCKDYNNEDGTHADCGDGSEGVSLPNRDWDSPGCD